MQLIFQKRFPAHGSVAERKVSLIYTGAFLQLIQIQNYGNRLNPLIVFYMLIAIIVPSLSVTFLTIISSLIGLNANTTTLVFLGLFVFVILIQIMFLGIIKSKRPSLL